MTDVLIDVVDSVEYSRSNCYVHQLSNRMQEQPVICIELSELEKFPKPRGIVCRLKQRTLFRVLDRVKRWADGAPVVIFDQDPWESFRPGSPYIGSYDRFRAELNVKSFAVTTQHWSELLKARNYPSHFVRMGMLPKYCNLGARFEHRLSELVFVGQEHPYRKKLFDELRSCGINVAVRSSRVSYEDYLNELSNGSIFIHNEDLPIAIDDKVTNLDVGLWIKDVEAMARGCFVIRNRSSIDASAHLSYLEGLRSYRLFDDVSGAKDVIDEIRSIDPETRATIIEDDVNKIRARDDWARTAETMVSLLK